MFTNNNIPAMPSLNPHSWVGTHADYLYAYAFNRLNDGELAKDLVQETFLAALERVDKFEGRSNERTWLTAILRNKIADVYRKRSWGLNELKHINDAGQDQHDFFDPDNGHWIAKHQPKEFEAANHDPLYNKELALVLQQCMQKLPALWLAVFTMKQIDDEATSYICRKLNVTEANIWVIIHRAKLNMRACLQKNWI